MKTAFVQRICAAGLAIVASTAVSPPARAQTVTDEVRCVLLSNALAAGSNNPRGRQVGASVGSYFMGRLDAREPAEVKAAIAGQNKRLPASQAASMMNACAARATRAEAQLRALAK